MTGNNANWSHFLDKLLGLIVQQKRLIISDKKFLPSYLTSLLGSSSRSLVVPRDVDQRYLSGVLAIFLHAGMSKIEGRLLILCIKYWYIFMWSNC